MGQNGYPFSKIFHFQKNAQFDCLYFGYFDGSASAVCDTSHYIADENTFFMRFYERNLFFVSLHKWRKSKLYILLNNLQPNQKRKGVSTAAKAPVLTPNIEFAYRMKCNAFTPEIREKGKNILPPSKQPQKVRINRALLEPKALHHSP